MTSFQRQFRTAWTCLDDRPGIGPHHLAIGKTRKLFELGDTIEAFYSEGYAIAHARMDAETLEIRHAASLAKIPVAWGGGAFCIDNGPSGDITLVFVHRNRHEFCAVRGMASNEGIAWGDWKVLLATGAPQAAPWVEVGPDGSAWCSVLSRDSDHRLAIMDPGGNIRTAPLFAANETPWYHSCVQVLPIARDRAVAVGFRGAFPTRTELVFKTISRDLVLGPSQTLAPCNVNDQFTFHFQAIGDAANGRAHIVYLDEGLSVSHAAYEGGEWRVRCGVLPFATYAPQICLDEAGRLALLACDYEGVVWTASWSHGSEWTEPKPVEALPSNTISGLFGRTGYGTGGLICAARSSRGRVPFLMGAITEESTGRAKLYAASTGRNSGLLLDAQRPISLAIAGRLIKGEIRLATLRKSDLACGEKSWTVCMRHSSGAPAKLTIATERGLTRARLDYTDADGREHSSTLDARLSMQFHDPFAQQDGCGMISFEIECPEVLSLLADGAWAETYIAGEAGSRILADIAPFEPEVAAKTAREPHRIPVLYKRMV